MRKATINDALHFIRAMSEPANGLGYVLAPYGSTVLNGRGRDIDIIAVPWRDPCDFGALIRMICERGYKEASDRYFGMMGTCAVLLQDLCGGPVIDLQIREVPRTQEVIDGIRKAMDLDVAGWH